MDHNTINSSSESINATNDSSYMLRQVSFDDSQVDNFVPYSSPYILCWHNNKERLEDVTLYHPQNNQTYSESNLSEVERGRGDDSSNLIQIAADTTLNSTSEGVVDKNKPRINVQECSINYESDKSEIKELSNYLSHTSSLNQIGKNSSHVSSLNEQLSILDLNRTKNSSNSIVHTQYSNSNDFLTNVTNTSQNSNPSVDEDKSLPTKTPQVWKQQRVQSIISSHTQTPTINLLGSDLKLKNNLNNRFNENSMSDSISKCASIAENILEETCNSELHKTNDMATSPIKFLALSPTASLAPGYPDTTNTFSENGALNQTDTNVTNKSVRADQSAKPVNETNHCEDLWEKSVEKIEFSYSEISERSKNTRTQISSTNTTVLSSVSSLQSHSSSVTNITKADIESDDDGIDIELDMNTLKFLNKNITKMIKKSFEKSKRLSINASSSANSLDSNMSSVSSCSSSTRRNGSSTLLLKSCESNRQEQKKQPDSPIIKNNMQGSLYPSNRISNITKSKSSSNSSNTSTKLKPIETKNLQETSPNCQVTLKDHFTDDKENQTHLNVPQSAQKPPTIERSNSAKRLQKDKIKEMLEAQKQQHERRIKALDRLHRLEQQQHEKLQSLLQTSHGESVLADSYFQVKDWKENYNDTIQLTEVENAQSLNRSAFNNLLSETENSFPQQKVLSGGESTVEVINLQDTTVHKQPEGVLVVKEKKQVLSQKIKKNESQTNGRVVFSNIGNTNKLSNLDEITRRESLKYSPHKPTPKSIKPQAWFLPVTPKPNHQPNPALRPIEHSVCQSPKTILRRRSHYTPLAQSEFSANQQVESVQNMSLQLAFETHKQDVIDRSIRRQDMIQMRSQERQQECEFRRQHYDLMMSKKLEHQEAVLKAKQQHLQRLKTRRRMSVQEIYSQNRKLYEKLPEVQSKQKQERCEADKKLNRMKTSIFTKSIQQNVLVKGPNFKMNYKAIDDFNMGY